MFLCFFLCAKESKKDGVWGDPPKIIMYNFQNINFMKIKWTTVKKILQIVATVITTILGTNIIQSCMNL